MAPATEATDDPIARTLEHEFDLVRSAIALVASGSASSVSLDSLRFGEQLLEPASRVALASRVRIRPLWSADETSAGLSIERMPDD